MPTPIALPPQLSRIVAVGDSITDGVTYPHLLKQAFSEAGYKPPVVINAGIGGNRARDISERLERDVISRKPSLVLLSAGVNDSNDVDPADYEAKMVSVLDRLAARNIPVILLTPSIIRVEDDPEHAKTKRITAFREILHRLAAQRGLKVAEVAEAMRQSRAAGLSQWGGDGIHLDFEGYRAFVRGVLDGLGYSKVSVPAKAIVKPLPGLLRTWDMVPLHDNAMIDSPEAIKAAFEGKPVQTLAVPQPQVDADWYWNLVRQSGFATWLTRDSGAKGYLARTQFLIEAPTSKFVNVNAANAWLQLPDASWKRLGPKDTFPRGWHAAPLEKVDFKPGTYTLVVQTGQHLFASLTDEDEL